MGYLSVVLHNTTDSSGAEQWYWEMKSPSGYTACYSPYFTCLKGAAQAARAFIYNMNVNDVKIPVWDSRIQPTDDPSRFNIPFEYYFREISREASPTSQHNQVEEEDTTSELTPVKTTIRKGHLSLVSTED